MLLRLLSLDTILQSTVSLYIISTQPRGQRRADPYILLYPMFQSLCPAMPARWGTGSTYTATKNKPGQQALVHPSSHTANKASIELNLGPFSGVGEDLALVLLDGLEELREVAYHFVSFWWCVCVLGGPCR